MKTLVNCQEKHKTIASTILLKEGQIHLCAMPAWNGVEKRDSWIWFVRHNSFCYPELSFPIFTLSENVFLSQCHLHFFTFLITFKRTHASIFRDISEYEWIFFSRIDILKRRHIERLFDLHFQLQCPPNVHSQATFKNVWMPLHKMKNPKSDIEKTFSGTTSHGHFWWLSSNDF